MVTYIVEGMCTPTSDWQQLAVVESRTIPHSANGEIAITKAKEWFGRYPDVYAVRVRSVEEAKMYMSPGGRFGSPIHQVRRDLPEVSMYGHSAKH